ncbi:carboxypeptidase-like regulatory domain-containing protein [Flavobacterium agrisoli]|uniref:TonB-dependent receptor plug domain-containing protein n=1 Tax=Flavobacterium agrisoli TaxID=2793066 RepID=A0A934UI25_9FLAO|nr:carboxypeptidase-like regulatory domain-containing protein [Flavobacterium agrisoli]MBK0368401.1 TonB-dependent receptor plug domain-containing protein [Flavobacterium agrisoli]
MYKSIYEKENNPLIVINGILLGNDTAFLNIINPKEIESITVLKDSAVTKIYGKGARKGVLILTLKNKNINSIEKFKTTYNLYSSGSEEIKITGTITNSQKNPIENVIITNLNRKESFRSDSQGKYTLTSRENDILYFYLKGYKSETIKIKNTKNDIVLKKDDTKKIK